MAFAAAHAPLPGKSKGKGKGKGGGKAVDISDLDVDLGDTDAVFIDVIAAMYDSSMRSFNFDMIFGNHFPRGFLKVHAPPPPHAPSVGL